MFYSLKLLEYYGDNWCYFGILYLIIDSEVYYFVVVLRFVLVN